MRVNERPWGGGPEERGGPRGRRPEEKGVWGEGRAWGRNSQDGGSWVERAAGVSMLETGGRRGDCGAPVSQSY